MKARNIGRTILVGLSVAAINIAVAAPAAPIASQERSKAGAVGELMRDWQVRILAGGLPVDDAKNWSRRNLAKFGRLNAERLALAQQARTLDELELILLEAPIPAGSRLDVLLATKPSDITLLGEHNAQKLTPATAPAAYSNLVFTAVTPCRILDSRASQGGTGPWLAGFSNLIKVGPYATGYRTGVGAQGGSTTSCGLDALAGPGQIAVIMAAVSTVSQSGAGYLTFYPPGAPNPGAASVSQWYQSGYVQTSFVMIPTDLAGSSSALGFTSASTDVIIDVVGYFISNAGNGNVTLVDSTANAGNIMKGVDRFAHNFGVRNTFVGKRAGNFTMSGNRNTAIGEEAFTVNTTGSTNFAGGQWALQNNVNGNSNTAIGYLSLSANTAGGSNTATGSAALPANTTGYGNTATGFDALFSNTTADYNTGIGALTLLNNATGTLNIALGYEAGSLISGSSNIAIGNSGVTGESGTVRIGTAGNHTKTFVAGIRGITTGASDAIAVMIDSNGQLGTTSSARRTKNDIADMDAASSGLMKLRPVTFHYKTEMGASEPRTQYGLIAEEVAEVYPGLVTRSRDGQAETVMYQFLPSMLLNEYQKQQRAMHAQTIRIAELERERMTQAVRINALETQAADIAQLQAKVARMATLLDQVRGRDVLSAGAEFR